MLEFAQDRPAIDIVKHVVIFVGLVWKPSVIRENILQTLAALELRFNPDGRSFSRCGGSRGSCAKRWYLFDARLPVMRERFGIECVSAGINVKACDPAGRWYY
jgi:hypothetical protein